MTRQVLRLPLGSRSSIAPPARTGAQRRLPVHGDRELLALIDLAYDAATQPDAWPALLEGLARAVGCDVAGLNVQDLRGGPASVQHQIGVDPHWTSRYETYFAPRNIFLAARPDLTFSGAIRNGEAIVPDRQAMRTEYFNDFLRPLGILHAIGMVPFRTDRVASLLSIMRRIGAPSFADSDFSLLERFMPHLQRAISIHRRLEAVDLARTAAADALDRMTFGIIILDRDGKPVFVNRQSESVLAQGDGLFARRPSASSPADAATLRRHRGRVRHRRGGAAAGRHFHVARRPPSASAQRPDRAAAPTIVRTRRRIARGRRLRRRPRAKRRGHG